MQQSEKSGTSLSHGKWHENVDGASLGELSALARDINKTIDQTIKNVARGKIRVGKLLLEARAIFTEDQAFGKWRKQETMVQSKQHAHYLMQVADKFGNAATLIDGVNYSVLQELVLAEDKDIKWIEKKVEEGEPIPTVIEVREKVKESKGTSKKGIVHSNTTTPIQSPHANLNQIVQMEISLRIKAVLDRTIKSPEGDYIILGMDPDPQTPCHPDALEAIRADLEESCTGDTLRIVGNSYQKIFEEFRDWHSA